MDLKDIKAIIDLMKKNSVSEFELEKQDFKIRLKRGTNGNTASGEEAPLLTCVQPGVALQAPLATTLPAQAPVAAPASSEVEF